MKTRNSLVSNSSSSSFICSRPIQDVARDMFEVVRTSWTEGWGTAADKKKAKTHFTKLSKNLDKGLALDRVKSGEIGITFPSCNYDTYLIVKDGKVLIQTSWNHDWEDGVEGLFGRNTEDETYRNEFGGVYFYDVRHDDIVSHDDVYLKQPNSEKPKTKCGCKNDEYSPYSYVNSESGKKYCTFCHKELTIL